MIDAMGIGLVLPIMPELIVEVQGGTLADAAIWGGVLSTAFAAMQFVFGPILGNLSDAYGRRAVLLVSLFVMSLDYVVMAIAGSIWLLLAGRIVGGITTATHATAAAFMADVSKPHEKAANFGLLGAAFGVGFVLGPVIGGLLSEYGTRAPFWAAAGLSALTCLAGLLVMPETVTDKKPPGLQPASRQSTELTAHHCIPSGHPPDAVGLFPVFGVDLRLPRDLGLFHHRAFRLVSANDRFVTGCLRDWNGRSTRRPDPPRDPFSG